MKRLPALDALRGLASLVVVFSHLHYTARAATPWVDQNYFRILGNSSFAVALFFTISGMVLFLQIRNERPGYLEFVVRRGFRLLPAAAVAVTISYLVYVLFKPQPVESIGPWFNDVSWPPGITFSAYLDHLTLWGPDALLRPLWSLVIEWKVSLIFPIYATLYLIFPRAVTLLLVGYALLFCGPLAWINATSYQNKVIVLFYLSFFHFGAMTAERWREIVLVLRAIPALRISFGLACAYYLLIRPQLDSFEGWITSAGISILLISFSLADSKARRFLRLAPCQYLGKISYSLYLIHMVWIGILFRLMPNANPLLTSALVIAVSILSADVMYRFVEVPFIRLGRRFAKRLRFKLFSAPGSVAAPRLGPAE